MKLRDYALVLLSYGFGVFLALAAITYFKFSDFFLALIVGALVGTEVPILPLVEPGGMTIEKSEICSAIVQVGVRIVLLGDGRQFTIIKQPDGECRVGNSGKLYLVA